MQRFKNILFVAGSTELDQAAVARALTLAENNQASLTIAGVVDLLTGDIQAAGTAVPATKLQDLAIAEKRAQLEVVAGLAATQEVPITVDVLVGKAFLEIIRAVLRNNHDLVIKSTEDVGGVKQTLFGSTDMHIMRKCPCPVWIIKPTHHEHYRRILAAVDRDPEDVQKDALNRQILEMATSLALAEFSELHIVHAWHLYAQSLVESAPLGLPDAVVFAMGEEEESDRREWLEDLMRECAVCGEKDAIDYLKPEAHIVQGDARHVVPNLAEELDVELIIMGTIARTGVPGLLIGNTAEHILSQIDCSVLALKPPGFKCPITLEG